MANVVVDAVEFIEGRLPPVCVLSGAPADDTMVLRARQPFPGLVLLVGGVLAALFADRLQSTLDGAVPVDAATYHRLMGRLALGRVMLLCAITAGAAGVLAALMASEASGGAQILWGCGSLFASVIAIWTARTGGPRWWSGRRLLVSAGIRRDARWIDLRRVHPGFVRAVDAVDADRASMTTN